MFVGVDQYTAKIIDEIQKRPTCALCGRKVDLSISKDEVTYLCNNAAHAAKIERIEKADFAAYPAETFKAVQAGESLMAEEK